MPIPFLASVVFDGYPTWLPEPPVLLQLTAAVGTVALIKWYTNGTTNPAERDMHGRVIMMTGGTSGIGAEVALELARRGAQLVLLTRAPPSDAFLVEYIEDLRTRAENPLIYAEQVDLASLHSIRQFATKWIDNAPPRRLDMVLLMAATLTPAGHARAETAEGVESTLMINYLANFHLLSILSPALRVQPFDRDVRVVMATCAAAYLASPPLTDPAVALARKDWAPGRAYARSKLALVTFGRALQQHLDAAFKQRPNYDEGLPPNARVVFVDPGLARTPGLRRWLTRGSLLGLLLYLLLWPVAWLLVKSARRGAQSVLFAAMEPSLGRGTGGKLVKECRVVDLPPRAADKEGDDEVVSKRLWEWSDKLVETVERAAALKRAREKEDAKKQAEAQKEKEKAAEIGSLVDAIKKGKQQQEQQQAAKKAAKTRRNA